MFNLFPNISSYYANDRLSAFMCMSGNQGSYKGEARLAAIWSTAAMWRTFVAKCDKQHTRKATHTTGTRLVCLASKVGPSRTGYRVIFLNKSDGTITCPP